MNAYRLVKMQGLKEDKVPSTSQSKKSINIAHLECRRAIRSARADRQLSAATIMLRWCMEDMLEKASLRFAMCASGQLPKGLKTEPSILSIKFHSRRCRWSSWWWIAAFTFYAKQNVLASSSITTVCSFVSRSEATTLTTSENSEGRLPIGSVSRLILA